MSRVYALSLLKAVESVKDAQGIFLKDIPEDALVEVHTQNSIYEITVIDPEDGKVAVCGSGRFFTRPEVCHLSGSTWGGSMLRVKWIGIGMHLEVVRIDGTRIVTSVVRNIEIKNNKEVADKLTSSAKPYVQ